MGPDTFLQELIYTEYQDAVSWSKTVNLPVHESDNLSKNYQFLKHMMNQIGIKKEDYKIVSPGANPKPGTIQVAFSQNAQQLASMAVLMWPKYANAKLESNL